MTPQLTPDKPQVAICWLVAPIRPSASLGLQNGVLICANRGNVPKLTRGYRNSEDRHMSALSRLKLASTRGPVRKIESFQQREHVSKALAQTQGRHPASSPKERWLGNDEGT